MHIIRIMTAAVITAMLGITAVHAEESFIPEDVPDTAGSAAESIFTDILLETELYLSNMEEDPVWQYEDGRAYMPNEQTSSFYRKRHDAWIRFDSEGHPEKIWHKNGEVWVEADCLSGEIRSREPAEDMLASLSVEEKAAQLFCVYPEALGSRQEVSDWMKEQYAGIPVGGIIHFSANISDPWQITSFNQQIHELGRIPVMISVDEEGGEVARIGYDYDFDVPRFDNMQYISPDDDPADAYDVCHQIGSYLKEYGFDADFAPVADVNTNPANPVIGSRAFSSDPETAAAMVSGAVRGFRDAGVLTSAKHFPGHGDTASDSHSGYAYSYKTWDEIRDCEMLPFISAIDAGTDMIMISHICVPEVTGDDIPSSLNPQIIDGKLRQELGYDGVAVTDSLEMGAIASYYSSADAAVMAFQAGADILLMPADLQAAYQGILDAVSSGEISEERLNASVLRILRMKTGF